MALTSIAQNDFSGGIVRARKAPPNALYDLVNGLIGDDGLPYRRGGSAYWSDSDAGESLYGIKSVRLAAIDAVRVLAWGQNLYSFNGVTPVKVFDPFRDYLGRPVVTGGVAVFPLAPNTTVGSQANQFAYYGGSLLPSGGSIAGTITVTAGSTAVTKVGGSTWVGDIDPGMFLLISGQPFGLVRSVDGADALTLAYPWSGTTTSPGSYSIVPSIEANLIGAVSLPADIPQVAKLYVGAASNRLLFGVGSRVYMAATLTFPFPADKDLYHDLPTASEITGIEGVGDTAFVFTTAGVWGIGNLALDPVDAYGNIQHVIQQISGEVILWGEYGITPWAQNGLIVPALDDVYVMTPDGASTPITGDSSNEKVRRLYRSYTATAGYQPGQATVHNGHLFLPVLNGTTHVDTLICRLDRGSAWSRWAGHAAGPGYAVKPAASGAAPKLLGINGQRVTDLTGCLKPTSSNATDADGTTSDLVIITSDYQTGGNQAGFVQKFRARYELTDDGDGATAAPTVTPAFSSDQDAGSFSNLTEKGEQDGGTGWGTSDGSKYQWTIVGKRRERIRFRLTVAGACASFVLRSVELLLRPSGRQ